MIRLNANAAAASCWLAMQTASTLGRQTAGVHTLTNDAAEVKCTTRSCMMGEFWSRQERL